MFYRKTRTQGYTLIELVVVIFIIGLITSVVLFQSGAIRFERKTALYAQQLESFIEVCQQQAILQPAVIGILFSADAYAAYYFEEGVQARWVALGNKDSFWKPRPIPRDISLTVNAPIVFHAGIISPQLVIQPSGDLTPFTIDVGYVDQAAHYRVNGNAAGEIFLEDLK